MASTKNKAPDTDAPPKTNLDGSSNVAATTPPPVDTTDDDKTEAPLAEFVESDPPPAPGSASTDPTEVAAVRMLHRNVVPIDGAADEDGHKGYVVVNPFGDSESDSYKVKPHAADRDDVVDVFVGGRWVTASVEFGPPYLA